MSSGGSWMPSSAYDTSNDSYGQGYHWGRSYLHKLPQRMREVDTSSLYKMTSTSSEEYGYFWTAKSIKEQREEKERLEAERKRREQIWKAQEEELRLMEDNRNPFDQPQRLFFPEIRSKPPAVMKDIERTARAGKPSSLKEQQTPTPRLPDINTRSKQADHYVPDDPSYGKKIRQIELVFEDDSVMTIPAYGEVYTGSTPRAYKDFMYKRRGHEG